MVKKDVSGEGPEQTAFSVRMDAVTYGGLKAYSNFTGESMNSIISSAVTSYLAQPTSLNNVASSYAARKAAPDADQDAINKAIERLAGGD